MPLLESIDQTNPYVEVQIDRRDLCVLQQRIKWENGVWSDLDQLAMRKRILHCCVRKEAHWDMSRWSDSFSKYINLPKLLLSSILGTSLVVESVGGSPYETVTYFNAICSVMLTFLTALTTFYSFEENKTAHRLSSLAYGRLVAEMERLIQTSPEDRDNFGNTLAELNDKYSAIRDDAPFLDKELLVRYVEQFGQKSEELYSERVSGVDLDTGDTVSEDAAPHELGDTATAQISVFDGVEHDSVDRTSRCCSGCSAMEIIGSRN